MKVTPNSLIDALDPATIRVLTDIVRKSSPNATHAQVMQRFGHRAERVAGLLDQIEALEKRLAP